MMLAVHMLLALHLADDAAAAPSGVSAWLTPTGALAAISILIALMPIVAAIASRLGFATAATTIQTLSADASALRGALASTVSGVESFRSLADPAVAQKLADTIRVTATADGTQDVLHAVVQAVTDPKSAPASSPSAPTADAVIQAVRTATGRIGAPLPS